MSLLNSANHLTIRDTVHKSLPRGQHSACTTILLSKVCDVDQGEDPLQFFKNDMNSVQLMYLFYYSRGNFKNKLVPAHTLLEKN